jgi:hypothetical protein
MVLSKLGVSGMIGLPPENRETGAWFSFESAHPLLLLAPPESLPWRGFAFLID